MGRLRAYRPGVQMRRQATRPEMPMARRPVGPAAPGPQAARPRKPMPPKPDVRPPKAGPAKKPALRKPTAGRLAPEQLFKRADRNGDGKLSYEEALRAGLLVRRPQPALKQAPVKKPPAEKQVPERRRMGQRDKPQMQKPAGAGLGRGPQPRASAAGDREVLENWDILKDLLSVETPEGGK